MRVFAALVVMAGVSGFVTADDAKDDDAKRFEGTWTMVRGEEDGKELPTGTVKAARLTIEGDKHTVKVGDVTMVGTHRLAPAKMPKTIDVRDTEGPFKDTTLRGIYQLKGDEFRVCFSAPGKERPMKFTTKSGTGHLFHVWKHQKQ